MGAIQLPGYRILIMSFTKTHSSVIVETLIFGPQIEVLIYSKLLKKWKKVEKKRAIYLFENYDAYFQVWADDNIIKIA